MQKPLELLGKWHIVATTLGFWRGKRDIVVEYTELPDGRWLDRLTWRKGSNDKLHALDGYDTWKRDRFQWRGAGGLFWITSNWRVVKAAPDGCWVVTWFSKATMGVTPEGMDVYSRTPDFRELDAVLVEVRKDPQFGKISGWYRTGDHRTPTTTGTVTEAR